MFTGTVSFLLQTRDVPDSVQPVLPAGNCVTGEYQNQPVLGCRFRYSQTAAVDRPRPAATQAASGVFVYLYYSLTNTSVWACQTYTPTPPLAKDTALGRPTSKYRTSQYLWRINTGTDTGVKSPTGTPLLQTHILKIYHILNKLKSVINTSMNGGKHSFTFYEMGFLYSCRWRHLMTEYCSACISNWLMISRALVVLPYQCILIYLHNKYLCESHYWGWSLRTATKRLCMVCQHRLI